MKRKFNLLLFGIVTSFLLGYWLFLYSRRKQRPVMCPDPIITRPYHYMRFMDISGLIMITGIHGFTNRGIIQKKLISLRQTCMT